MRARVACCAALGWLFATAAAASTPRVDLQIFHPAPGGTDFVTVHSGTLGRHLSQSYGANLNYGHNILAITELGTGGQSQPVGSVVRHRIDLDLLAAVGLWGWGELGVVVPLVYVGGFDGATFASQQIDLGTQGLRAVTLGDVRLVPKVRALNFGDGALALAVVPTVVLPTAGGAPYAGERGASFMPTLALSGRRGPLRAGIELGYHWRRPATIATVTLGQELTYAAAIALDPSLGRGGPLEIVAEAFGTTQLAHPFGAGMRGEQAMFQRAGTPAEADLSLRVSLGNFIVRAGVGVGLSTGYGAPLPRAFLAGGYYSANSGPPDRDHDGIPDDQDRCPDRAEDHDGFEDADGCPDPDNDHDGVLDEDDQCPLEPEDRDGFQDEDGCPDPDNDNDGIPDAQDKCPNEPEDKDGFQDEDGCPDLDNDNDGIPDALDRCPNEAEDLDGFEDADGCPDLDNDHDGLPDLNDQCPNFPEDKDGFQDDDGCPEDNDADGIPDAQDRCPNQPENYNGFEDEDGCPDKPGSRPLAKITDEKIAVLEPVRFKRNSAVLEPRSRKVLDVVATVLRNARQITRVRIEGHTDSVGSRQAAIKLSLERAASVRSYLIAHGIAAARLEAAGLGPDRPVATNKTEAGREKNRRVEMVIVSQHPVGPEAAPAKVAPAPPPPPIAPAPSGAATGTPPPPAPLFELAPPPAPPAPPPPASGGDIQFGF